MLTKRDVSSTQEVYEIVREERFTKWGRELGWLRTLFMALLNKVKLRTEILEKSLERNVSSRILRFKNIIRQEKRTSAFNIRH